MTIHQNLKRISTSLGYLLAAVVILFVGVTVSRADSVTNRSVLWNQETVVGDPISGESMSGATFNGNVYLLGGNKGGVHLSDVWKLDVGDSQTSTSVKSASWSGRTGQSASVFNSKLYMTGGFDGGSFLNDVWAMSSQGGWELISSNAAWTPRAGAAMFVFDNKLWIAGGRDATGYRNDLWSSSDGIAWEKVVEPSGWSARADSNILVFKNKLWLIGGVNADGRVNDVWSSADGINWKIELSDAPWTGDYGVHAVTDDSKLYLVSDGDRGYSQNDLWTSEDGVNWKQELVFQTFPFVTKHSLVMLGDKIFLVGGINYYGEYSDTLYSYSTAGVISVLAKYPKTPTNLTATAGEPGSNLINLNWATSTNVDFYKIFRGTLSGAEIFLASTTVDNIPYVDEGAMASTSGTTYFYQVVATNEVGDSATSSEVSAKSLPPPGHPTLITSNPTDLGDIKINAPTKLQWVVDDQDREPLNYIVNWGDTLQDTGVLQPSTIVASCAQMVGQPTSCGSGATLYEPLTLTHAWSAAGNYNVLLAIGGTLGDHASSKITLQVVDTATLVDLINIKLSAASTPLSAKNINDFNSLSQEIKADFIDSQDISHGSIDINFPKDSLYGVSGSPTVTLQAISNNELNKALTPSPLSQIPPNLEQLTDYVFGFQVLSDKNLDILKSNIPIRLQLNNISDITKWGSARLYQYVCIDYNLDTELCLKHAWVPISEKAAVTKVNALLEAKTLDTRLGLIAIFGQK